MKITTDNKWKNFLYGNEVPKKVLKYYNWLSKDDKFDGWMKYKRNYLHITDFTTNFGIKSFPFENWDGYFSNTYFSGYLIKVSKDCEQYKIGYYYS